MDTATSAAKTGAAITASSSKASSPFMVGPLLMRYPEFNAPADTFDDFRIACARVHSTTSRFLTRSPPMRQSISMALLARLTATTAALALALALSGCGGGGGGGTTSVPVPVPPTPAPTYFDSTVYSTAAGASLGQGNELAAG